MPTNPEGVLGAERSSLRLASRRECVERWSRARTGIGTPWGALRPVAVVERSSQPEAGIARGERGIAASMIRVTAMLSASAQRPAPIAHWPLAIGHWPGAGSREPRAGPGAEGGIGLSAPSAGRSPGPNPSRFPGGCPTDGAPSSRIGEQHPQFGRWHRAHSRRAPGQLVLANLRRRPA